MKIANLPEVEFASKSVEAIEASLITRYEQKAGRTLAPGDPVRLLLETFAYMIAQQRALIDYTGKQNLLAYSTGDNLLHIGVLVDTDILEDSAAKTTLRFSLSEVQPQAVVIPKGTRATPGDNLLFATTETLVIPAGQAYGDMAAECTETGLTGNGYSPGQINKIVDPIQWVATVTNTTKTEGGADVEKDDAYRERISEAPEKFSTAGPDGAYRYFAKSVSSLIVDASVSSPSAGAVEIRPLLAGGGIPGKELLDAVYAACSDNKVRPLTDKVVVLPPETISYSINATYWIAEEYATAAVNIQAEVMKAVAAWEEWQKMKLGRSINPSELVARMMAAGAKRVEVIAPAYKAITKAQVAIASGSVVTFGGMEDG